MCEIMSILINTIQCNVMSINLYRNNEINVMCNISNNVSNVSVYNVY